MFWWADGSWFYWLSELILSNWYLTQGNSVGVFFLRALSSWWNQACKVSYQTSGITICSLESLDRPERKRRRQESQCQLSIWSYSRALSGNQRFSIWSCFRALSDNWQLPHDYWMVIYQFHNCYCYLHVKIKHLQYIRAFLADKYVTNCNIEVLDIEVLYNILLSKVLFPLITNCTW